MTSSSPDAGAFARLRSAAAARLGAIRTKRLALLTEWRLVLRHAWSVRFMALATLLDTAQASVSFFSGSELVAPGTLAASNMVLGMAALFARFVAQEKISGPAAAGDA